ncbi:MAG: DUF1778 domain-containing protein [Gammaproteobacteria bacterium]|nr:DUF1778 domain-containing protein [Gammaproteobacteria bacterium]MCW8839872.1 DUF1778 domain-containing protein [Gammaproteobacteria bacterium]MCW8958914.1 DUF1778 domain-containing protein [Gammaproteobacteria bacterium]MCW8992412.1 DUF1778 domain-containing protein [Gammaproteobacteria bacterium]
MGKSKIIDTVIESAQDLHGSGVMADKELLDLFLNIEPEQMTLTEEQYDRLVKTLDADPQSNDKLRELLARKAPWE